MEWRGTGISSQYYALLVITIRVLNTIQVTPELWKNPDLEGELGRQEVKLGTKKWRKRW